MDYQNVTIEELEYLAKFTSSELTEFIRSLKLLISNNGNYDNILQKDIISNCTEITTYLPKIIHVCFDDNINALTKLIKMLIEFAQKYPNSPLTPCILEAINEINRYFKRFNINTYTSPSSSSELSLSPSSNDDEEDRMLHQRVVNPNATANADRKAYDKMLKDMCRSAKDCRLETHDNFKLIANALAAKPEGPSEYDKAVSELLLRGVSNLKDRESKYSHVKQQLSEPLDENGKKQKKRKDLLNIVADGLFDERLD